MVYAGGTWKRRARGLIFFVVVYIITLNGKKCWATLICDLVVFLHTLRGMDQMEIRFIKGWPDQLQIRFIGKCIKKGNSSWLKGIQKMSLWKC